MGWQATLSDMVSCHLLMYTLMMWIPSTSTSYTAEGYSHSLPAPHFAVILVICHAARWWNPFRTLRISPITTQILLLYNITDC